MKKRSKHKSAQPLSESVLNELEIAKRLVHPDKKKRLIVTPLINSEQQIGPSSIDLRLGSEFEVIKSTRFLHLDPLKQSEDEIRTKVLQYSERIKLSVMDMEPFILHPGQFALSSTLEFVKMPIDLVARLEGKSTWGRLGLQVHSTAGFVEPGYKGCLIFELQNAGTLPISLYVGVRIAQLTFYLCRASTLPYEEKPLTSFARQIEIKASPFYALPEFKYLRFYKDENKASEE